MRIIENDRYKTGKSDLQAIEMFTRSTLHNVGASVLAQLLQGEIPATDQRTSACPCGQKAHYKDLRSKTILTVLGEVQLSHPYYLCANCHSGQFPADVELDIHKTEFSPGVRRMQALVGMEAPFDNGRRQMKLLAGLDVTTKAVERVAESIGEDIAAYRVSAEVFKCRSFHRRAGMQSHGNRAVFQPAR